MIKAIIEATLSIKEIMDLAIEQVAPEVAKEIHNRAIEEAMRQSRKAIGYENVSALAFHVENEIRKLKK